MLAAARPLHDSGRPVPGRPKHGEAEMNGSQTRWG